ncbi:MAG TPA: rhodanese-like domain-containing protein [Oculatellaceae cyanobacterium]
MSNQPNAACPYVNAFDLPLDKEVPVLLDVRSPIEFANEHIAGAMNVPLDALNSRSGEVPRERELIVICRSGRRAQRGAYILLGLGFHPKVLDGGMVAWRKAGRPIQEGKKRLPIERQIQLIVGSAVLIGVMLGIFVNSWFLAIPVFFGAGLTFAGLSGTCALGILLEKAPWNKLESPSGQKQDGRPDCCA